MERYNRKYLKENDDEEENLPNEALAKIIHSYLYKYFTKGGFTTGRAGVASDKLLNLANYIIKSGYDMSTAKLLDRYLNQFYARID